MRKFFRWLCFELCFGVVVGWVGRVSFLVVVGVGFSGRGRGWFWIWGGWVFEWFISGLGFVCFYCGWCLVCFMVFIWVCLFWGSFWCFFVFWEGLVRGEIGVGWLEGSNFFLFSYYGLCDFLFVFVDGFFGKYCVGFIWLVFVGIIDFFYRFVGIVCCLVFSVCLFVCVCFLGSCWIYLLVVFLICWCCLCGWFFFCYWCVCVFLGCRVFWEL